MERERTEKIVHLKQCLEMREEERKVPESGDENVH